MNAELQKVLSIANAGLKLDRAQATGNTLGVTSFDEIAFDASVLSGVRIRGSQHEALALRAAHWRSSEVSEALVRAVNESRR